MIVTNNEEIYKKIVLMRSHGMTTMSYQRASGHATSYDVVDLGYNYRMDDIRASIGIVQLDKLKSDLGKRMEIRKWYIEFLEGFNKISIPFLNHDEFTSNYIFPIVLNESTEEKRDLLRTKLQERGIQTSVHYPAIHLFSAYANYSRKLPNTEYVSDNAITLPMYGKLEKEQVKYICTELIECFNELNQKV